MLVERGDLLGRLREQAAAMKRRKPAPAGKAPPKPRRPGPLLRLRLAIAASEGIMGIALATLLIMVLSAIAGAFLIPTGPGVRLYGTVTDINGLDTEEGTASTPASDGTARVELPAAAPRRRRSDRAAAAPDADAPAVHRGVRRLHRAGSVTVKD